MRKYELMAIFPSEEEQGKAALESVKAVLTEFGAEIEKEDLFGDRDLCYEIKKHTRGHFILLIIKVNPAKLIEIDRRFKLVTGLLKFMFTRVDE
ncbi:MAG: 30S ribosomal protein S6 [Spirochaetaceae bacterium]|jgi:small subunit ribosomal protein S6|nr:30S ribosomal protein S6 [Spirochaetaceae bacterium]